MQNTSVQTHRHWFPTSRQSKKVTEHVWKNNRQNWHLCKTMHS